MTSKRQVLATVLLAFFLSGGGGTVKDALAGSTFYSFVSTSRSLDDGNKVITKFEETNMDSSKMLAPIKSSTLMISPSISRALDGIDRRSLRKQAFTNQIGEESSGDTRLDQFIRARQMQGPSYRRRGFITTARTVESPAFSVDSGGQSSSSLAQEFAKLFNVKQGFYSDMYNRIDSPVGPQTTTRKPADVIEETVRNNVEHLFSDAKRRRHVTSNHRSLNTI